MIRNDLSTWGVGDKIPPMHLPSTVKSLTLMCLAGGLLTPFARSAEDADTLTVQATRLQAEPVEQPYTYHRIDGETYDRMQVQQPVEALAALPGVYVQRTAGNQASPYIRGLTGQQTLILFDGVRLNNALNRSGPNQYSALIPAGAVEGVDLILGSTSSVTGSDGLTGAVDFRGIEAGRGVTAPASVWVRGQEDTANGTDLHAGFDGRAKGVAYSFSGGAINDHDRRGGRDAGDHLFAGASGDKDIPNSGYHQWDATGKVALVELTGQQVEVSGGRTVQADAPRADGYRENSNVASAISRYYDPQTFTWAHARHILKGGGMVPRIQTTGWFHDQHEVQFREDLQGSGVTQRYRRRENDDGVATVGLDLQLTSRIQAHELTYGGTGYRDRLRSEFTLRRSPAGSLDPGQASVETRPSQDGGPGQSTVPDGATYDGQALFVQDLWTLGERFDLLAGVRFSRYAWSGEVTNDRGGYGPATFTAATPLISSTVEGSAQAATGSLRVGWHPVDQATVYAGIGQGFRAPTWSDLAGAQSRASSSVPSYGNPDLKPERSLTYEIGAKAQEQRDSASIALFYTQLTDLIQSTYVDVNGDGVYNASDKAVTDNAKSGRIAGIEIAHDLGCPGMPAGQRLALTQVLTATTGEMEQQDAAKATVSEVHISRANRVFGTVGVIYEPQPQWYSRIQLRWSGAYKEPGPGDSTDVRHVTFASVDGAPGGMPGWAVADVGGGWRSPAGGLRLDAAVRNLADVSYREVGSGIDGAGLSGVITVAARY